MRSPGGRRSATRASASASRCPHVRGQREEGELFCAIGWSSQGIAWDATDGSPVHLVVMYYIPGAQKNVYLKEVSTLVKADPQERRHRADRQGRGPERGAQPPARLGELGAGGRRAGGGRADDQARGEAAQRRGSRAPPAAAAIGPQPCRGGARRARRAGRPPSPCWSRRRTARSCSPRTPTGSRALEKEPGLAQRLAVGAPVLSRRARRSSSRARRLIRGGGFSTSAWPFASQRRPVPTCPNRNMFDTRSARAASTLGCVNHASRETRDRYRDIPPGDQRGGHDLRSHRPRARAPRTFGCGLPAVAGRTCRIARPRREFRQVPMPGLPIPGYPLLRMGLPARRRLRRLWSEDRPDLVHVATEGPLGLSAIRAARSLGDPGDVELPHEFPRVRAALRDLAPSARRARLAALRPQPDAEDLRAHGRPVRGAVERSGSGTSPSCRAGSTRASSGPSGARPPCAPSGAPRPATPS